MLTLLALIVALAGQALLARDVMPWGAVALLAGAALAVAVLPRRLLPPSSSQHIGPWLAAALALLLTVLAAGLRLYRIDEIPPGLWLDETDLARSAIEIIEGARPPLFGVGHIEAPNLYRYYLAGYYWLLGASYLTVKLPAIVAGALTTPAIYLLGRRFLRVELALAAAFLWAASRWSINISRWGHVAALAPLFACLAFWLVWRGLESNRWRYWLPAGVALALSQYTYQSARVIPIVAVLFVIFWIASHRQEFFPRPRQSPAPAVDAPNAGSGPVAPPDRDSTRLRSRWLPLLAGCALFLALYAPLAATYLRDPLLFSERAKGISIFNPLYSQEPLVALQDSALKYLQAFNYHGDLNPRHNLVGAPALDVVTGALFVVGLAYAFWRWRQPATFLLLAWFGAVLAGGVLTQGAPNIFRIYGLAPAVLLLAVLALQAAWQRWTQPGGALFQALWPSGRWLLAGLMMLALGWAADANIKTFFRQQAEQPGAWKDFNVDATRLAQALHELPGDPTVYLDRNFFGWSPIDVINPDLDYERLMLPWHVLMPPPAAEGQSVALGLGSYNSQATPFLQERYPHGQTQVIRNELGDLLGAIFVIPAEDLARGLRRLVAPAAGAEPGQAAGWAGEPAALAAETPGAAAAPYTVEWWGGLRLAEAGPYAFRLQATNPTTLTIAGDTTLSAGQAHEVWLPAGLLPVRVQRRIERPAEDQLLVEWQPPAAPASSAAAGQVEWQPLPPDLLYPIPATDNGLLALYYEGNRFDGPPLAVVHDPLLLTDNAGNLAAYAERWLGQVNAPVDGVYRFATVSDDGSRLLLDRELLVDNWGLHGTYQREAEAALADGAHAIELRYFDRGGGYWLAGEWQPPDAPGWQPLAEAPLGWRPADVQAALQPAPSPLPAAIPAAEGEAPTARVLQADERWPTPRRNANFQGWLLVVKDDVFDQGIGVYSPSELAFNLAGRHGRLTGAAGVDGDSAGDHVAGVQIIGDGRVLWESGPRWVFEPALPFDVDVRGVQELRLKVIDAGYGENRPDAVDWVDLLLE